MSNNFTDFRKEEKEINSNDVISEIESSSGTHVPLSKVNLGKKEDEENLLSQGWSSADNKIKKPTESFSPFYSAARTSDELERESENNGNGGGSKQDNITNAKAIGDKSDTRNRIESAIEPESKKSVNPRIVKMAMGIAAVVVAGAILILGMKGEKRKSIFAKDKEGVAVSGTNTAEGTTPTDTQNSTENERRNGGLKFGDVAVGSDPNARTGGKNEPVTPESTEEAKNTENLDLAANVSPTPVTPFMPSYSGYQSSPAGGNQNSTTGGSQQSDGQTNSVETDEPDKNQNKVKTNKGDLSETALGLETDEDRFRTVMRAGQNNKTEENRSDQTNPQPENAALNAGLQRGTKMELMLDEPIRSGIATAVTGKLKKGVTNKRGEIIIPKDSTIVVQFSAEVANGRVFNDKEAPIQIITPEGKSFEVSGMVKDAQGFAGLTGKITKVGGRSALGKIGGVLGRVGGSLPGGQIITGTQQGIDGINSGGYVREAAQIVEIPRGTSFLLIIGY